MGIEEVSENRQENGPKDRNKKTDRKRKRERDRKVEPLNLAKAPAVPNRKVRSRTQETSAKLDPFAVQIRGRDASLKYS